MKFSVILIIIICLLQCCQLNQPSESISASEKEEVQKNIVGKQGEDSSVNRLNTTHPSCVFDAERFNEKMRIGLMTVLEGQMKPYNYYQRDSIILFDSAGQKLVMRRYDLPQPDYFWGIKINEEPFGNFIEPFHYSSEGQPDMLRFIWKSGNMAESNVVIQSFPDGATFRVENSPFFMLSSWKKTLAGSIVALRDNYVLRTKPDENSPVADDSFKKFAYFTVVDFKDEWIQLVYLDPKDPSMKKKQEPCGWVKWYCNGSFQLEFADNFFLESYYQREEINDQ